MIRLEKTLGTWVLYLGRLHLAFHRYSPTSHARPFGLRQRGPYGYAFYVWKFRFYASVHPTTERWDEPAWGGTDDQT